MITQPPQPPKSAHKGRASNSAASAATVGAGIVLAIDPSSTCTGYALCEATGKLHEAGRLVPRGKTALERIHYTGRLLTNLISVEKPSIIVIEVSTSRYGTARKMGSNTIVVYGAAWGYLLHVCEASGVETRAVEANEWTKGSSKDSRKLAALAIYGYDVAKDRGGDVSDAIALVKWFMWRLSK